MTYDDYVTERERRIARWLAVAMHVAFLLLLVFGVAWQKRHSEPAAVVDLWSSLPAPRPEPVPIPKPAPKPEAKPEPKPVPPPPPPKAEAKPAPKPDIALKEKLEKERKLKEQRELEKKKQAEVEKRKQDEAKKLKAEQMEARKKEEEKRKLEKERIVQEAEAKRLAQEKSDMAAKLAKEQAAAQARLNEKYIALIQNHVKRQIVEPPNLQGNPQVEFDVVLIPGGEVLTVKLRRSSGVPAYDAAVERAILKASPLPLPPDPALFQQFRDLHLKIRPKE
ncbi:MAG TPA: cell envelope integrity protein TolA [Burkholderiales bacterium]|nr:cell envelope integrity protein TolA [Burkholderiales bacterium]